MDVKNKKVLVVGYGKSGQAAARFCLEQGALVTVTDLKPASEFTKDEGPARHASLRLAGEAGGRWTTCSSSFVFGGHPLHLFDEADIVVVSPGVTLTLEGVVRAKKRGIPVVSEMELAEIKAPIIAVTGTNGKSTVTTLIGNILTKSGIPNCVGGNIGVPLVDLMNQARDAKYVVLEVSSFQLETTPGFHPHIAVLLNITPDHLDRYSNFEGYVAAKALIVRNMTADDWLVFNESDPAVSRIARNSRARLAPFSGDSNINRENMLASAMAGGLAGATNGAAGEVFENFRGLPHRIQFVCEINGVKFYDDSKGTNIGAVVRALESFDAPVVLIAGGLNKGLSFEPLRPVVKKKAKGLILLGSAREDIRRQLGDLVDTILVDDMSAAVREAAARADPGDIVLLSPGCASFDMFKDYAHRGEVFQKEVNRLGCK